MPAPPKETVFWPKNVFRKQFKKNVPKKEMVKTVH